MCTEAYREALTEEFFAATATTPVSSTATAAATTPAAPPSATDGHPGRSTDVTSADSDEDLRVRG